MGARGTSAALKLSDSNRIQGPVRPKQRGFYYLFLRPFKLRGRMFI